MNFIYATLPFHSVLSLVAMFSIDTMIPNPHLRVTAETWFGVYLGIATTTYLIFLLYDLCRLYHDWRKEK